MTESECKYDLMHLSRSLNKTCGEHGLDIMRYLDSNVGVANFRFNWKCRMGEIDFSSFSDLREKILKILEQEKIDVRFQTWDVTWVGMGEGGVHVTDEQSEKAIGYGFTIEDFIYDKYYDSSEIHFHEVKILKMEPISKETKAIPMEDEKVVYRPIEGPILKNDLEGLLGTLKAAEERTSMYLFDSRYESYSSFVQGVFVSYNISGFTEFTLKKMGKSDSPYRNLHWMAIVLLIAFGGTFNLFENPIVDYKKANRTLYDLVEEFLRLELTTA